MAELASKNDRPASHRARHERIDRMGEQGVLRNAVRNLVTAAEKIRQSGDVRYIDPRIGELIAKHYISKDEARDAHLTAT